MSKKANVDETVKTEKKNRRQRRKEAWAALTFKQRLIKRLTSFMIVSSAVILCGFVAVLGAFYYWGQDLPDPHTLENYEPPLSTRLYASDGRLLREFAMEKRVFIPYDMIPQKVKDAFIAVEDKNFYDHFGIDFMGIVRSAVKNMQNTDGRLSGGSTITQQVAKNFFLSPEKSYVRKAKEAILSIRIENTFSKEKILELYLNQIYLGGGAYGVGAASMLYFNKSLEELSPPEIAFLAGLPKAPSTYHPSRNPELAVQRRNWSLHRMQEEGLISEADEEYYSGTPINLVKRENETDYHIGGTLLTKAPYFAEEVRRQVKDKFGDDALYKGGLCVSTTMDPKLQEIASEALRTGIIRYDRKFGWRGPLMQLNLKELESVPTPLYKHPDPLERRRRNRTLPLWTQVLNGVDVGYTQPSWKRALVMEVNDDVAEIGVEDGTNGVIPVAGMSWAREPLINHKGQPYVGPRISKASQVLKQGDVIVVSNMAPPKKADALKKYYQLEQMPKVNGGLVVMNPHSGRVLAASGGYDYRASEYNRATQAYRQTGSAFKPFLYLAGLEQGMTPATMILDEPVVIEISDAQGIWKPKNYSSKFHGLNPMRVGLEKSFNMSALRVTQLAGIESVAMMGRRFGIASDMDRYLSIALGSTETTLLKMCAAYSILANGGRRVTPNFIDRIQNRYGKTVFRHDQRQCDYCFDDSASDDMPPRIVENREMVIDPVHAYQLTSMLEGVIARGTGRRARVKGHVIAGKSGTTNDYKDAWFIAYSADLLVGVYMGFDNPAPLGTHQSGGALAAPIVQDVMEEALKDQPAIAHRVPPGVTFVRMNLKTGRRALPGDRHVIMEAFKTGTEPKPGDPAETAAGEEIRAKKRIGGIF